METEKTDIPYKTIRRIAKRYGMQLKNFKKRDNSMFSAELRKSNQLILVDVEAETVFLWNSEKKKLEQVR